MFCYQCEQTTNGTGCQQIGVCGKDPETAALQDLLVHATKGLSMYAHRAAKLGARGDEIDRLMLESLFATVTNVDFDPARIEKHLRQAAMARDKARHLYEIACIKAGQAPEKLAGPAVWQPATDRAGSSARVKRSAYRSSRPCSAPTSPGCWNSRSTASKAPRPTPITPCMLGYEDAQIYAAFHEALDFLAGQPISVDAILGWVLKTGELNLKVMEMLDACEHRDLRPSRADRRKRPAAQGQGDPRLRPRPERPRRTAQADRRQGHQRLHARRDAALPRLSGLEEVQASGGQLRRRMAGSDGRVRCLSRPDPHDDQLHPEAAAQLSEPHFHQRSGGLAGRAAHRSIAISRRSSTPRCPPPASRKTRRRRRLPSASAATR